MTYSALYFYQLYFLVLLILLFISTLSTFFLPKPVDHSRDTFERLVEKFPTSGRYWKMYIDHEVSENLLSVLCAYYYFWCSSVMGRDDNFTSFR